MPHRAHVAPHRGAREEVQPGILRGRRFRAMAADRRALDLDEGMVEGDLQWSLAHRRDGHLGQAEGALTVQEPYHPTRAANSPSVAGRHRGAI